MISPDFDPLIKVWYLAGPLHYKVILLFVINNFFVDSYFKTVSHQTFYLFIY